MDTSTDPNVITLTKEEIFAILDAHADEIERAYLGDGDPDDVFPLRGLIFLL